MEITKLNESLNSETLNQDERREKQRMLLEKESALEKMEEHLTNGTSVW